MAADAPGLGRLRPLGGRRGGSRARATGRSWSRRGTTRSPPGCTTRRSSCPRVVRGQRHRARPRGGRPALRRCVGERSRGVVRRRQGHLLGRRHRPARHLPPWPRPAQRGHRARGAGTGRPPSPAPAGHQLGELSPAHRPRARPLQRVVRVLPQVGGRRRGPPGQEAAQERHLRDGGRAPAGRRGDGLRRRLPAPDPPDRPNVPQGSQQHPRPRPARPRRALGDRVRPRVATTRSIPSSARSPTSTRSSRRLATSASRWRSTTRCRPPPTIPGPPSTRSGSRPAPTARSPTRRTRPKKYQDIYPINFDNDPPGIYARGPAHPAALDGPRRADLPGRQPAHQAGRVLGVAARRGPPDRPRRALPGRGVHPAGDDAQLAKVGFHQSYTYFTWRNGQGELEEYLTELSTETAHLHAAQLLRQHARHPARVAAVRRPAGVQDPRRAGLDAVPVLGRLRRLRAVRARRRTAG